MTFRFLGEFASPDMQFLPRVGEYYSFYSWFLLGLGLVFQIPVIIFVLARIGLVTAPFLLRNIKYATLIIAVAGAILSPGGDIASQMILAGPMMGLYVFSIGVAWVFQKRKRPETES